MDGKQPQFSPEQIEQFKVPLRTAQPDKQSDTRRLRLGYILLLAAIIAVMIWVALR